jgi:hypothetical protein
MTALLGNRTPLSISETTVLDSGVGSWRVRASSERNEGLSALRWTIRKNPASSLRVVTDARSRSSVYDASSTSGSLSAGVRYCARVYDQVRGVDRGRPALGQAGGGQTGVVRSPTGHHAETVA